MPDALIEPVRRAVGLAGRLRIASCAGRHGGGGVLLPGPRRASSDAAQHCMLLGTTSWRTVRAASAAFSRACCSPASPVLGPAAPGLARASIGAAHWRSPVNRLRPAPTQMRYGCDNPLLEAEAAAQWCAATACARSRGPPADGGSAAGTAASPVAARALAAAGFRHRCTRAAAGAEARFRARRRPGPEQTIRSSQRALRLLPLAARAKAGSSALSALLRSPYLGALDAINACASIAGCANTMSTIGRPEGAALTATRC